MKNIQLKIFLYSVVTILISCDEPKCKSSNPIFNTNDYTTKVYQSELAAVLGKSNTKNLRFWLKSYSEENEHKYLNVSIQGENICAIAIINITKIDSKIKGIIDTKGVSYRGAELKNLKFHTLRDKKSTRFIYDSLGAIID